MTPITCICANTYFNIKKSTQLHLKQGFCVQVVQSYDRKQYVEFDVQSDECQSLNSTSADGMSKLTISVL